MNNGYEIDAGRIGMGDWDAVVRSFEDASVYQSWSWGAVRWGEKSLSHVLLRKDGRMVAASQAWIKSVPFLKKGIAYVKWGPLWHPRSGDRHLHHYRRMLRALREEYCEKRGLLLRITPNLSGLCGDEVRCAPLDEGFERSRNSIPYRTLLVDLSRSTSELRKGLKRQWRQCLNRAESENLTVRCGSGEEMFDAFEQLYREMHQRKGFAEFLNVDQIRAVHNALPDSMKLTVFVCESGGRPLSAEIVSCLGSMAIGLLAATCVEGLRLHSSHLIQWRIMEHLKSSGCRWYDLGGIDPVNYAGTYKFKSGLAGESGMDALFSDFEFSGGISSRLAVETGDHLRMAHRRFKEWAARLRHA